MMEKRIRSERSAILRMAKRDQGSRTTAPRARGYAMRMARSARRRSSWGGQRSEGRLTYLDARWLETEVCDALRNRAGAAHCRPVDARFFSASAALPISAHPLIRCKPRCHLRLDLAMGR